MNLISRKDIEHLEGRHLAHCLAITPHLKLMPGAQLMDVGTGGGFPGLILAICYPEARFTLVDSVGKKIAVVADMVERLGLKNVEVKHARAEAVKQEFDFITGRAVKNLPEFFSWIRGNVRCGQRNSIPNGVLYWKGGALDDEFSALGIRPRCRVELAEKLTDLYPRAMALHRICTPLTRNQCFWPTAQHFPKGAGAQGLGAGSGYVSGGCSR